MNYQTMKVEIEKNPQLLTKESLDGKNELLYSATDVETLKLLKEKGVKLDKLSKNFDTVLTKFVSENNLECVKYLLENGLSHVLDFYDEAHNKTPIFYAKSAEMVDLLVKYGANVHAEDEDGKGLLHKTFQYKDEKENDIALIKKLLSLGLDINGRDIIDNTPIFYQQNTHIAEEMLHLGANLKAFNKFSTNPKTDYLKSRNKAMVKWFNSHVLDDVVTDEEIALCN